MKKINLLFCITFLILACCNYGYAEENLNSTEYVRRDVFDAKMEVFFERLQNQINEGFNRLDRKIEDVRTDLNQKIDGVHNELTQKIDGVRTELNQKIDDVHNELTQKIEGVRTDLNQKIDDVHNELTQKIEGVRTDLNQKIDGVRNELNQKIDGVDRKVDILTARVDVLETVIYWALAFMGIILASTVLLPVIIEFYKRIQTPILSREEIKALIRECLTEINNLNVN